MFFGSVYRPPTHPVPAGPQSPPAGKRLRADPAGWPPAGSRLAVAKIKDT